MARAQRILALERDMIRAAQEEADVLRGRLAIGASTGPGRPSRAAAPDRLPPPQQRGRRWRSPSARRRTSPSACSHTSSSSASWAPRSRTAASSTSRSAPTRSCSPCRRATRRPAASCRSRSSKREPLVVQQEGSGVRAIVEAELRRLGVRPRDLNVVAELGLQESSQTAVEEGLGATFTSRAAIERELELGPPRLGARDGADPAARLRRRAAGGARAVAPGHGVRRVLPRGVAQRQGSGP